MGSVTKAITGQNSFSDPIDVHGSSRNVRYGQFNVSIWGTFVANITLQRSFDGGTTWLDVISYSAPIEDAGTEVEPALYRIGVKTGGFTSGTVNVRIGA